jgi:hypothetical protein
MGIAFFMKQTTRNKPIPVELLVREFPPSDPQPRRCVNN